MRLRLLLATLCLLLATHARAWLPHGSGTPSLNFPLSAYASYANGPPSDGSYFPILIWVVDPLQTTGIPLTQPNAGAAAKAVGINTFLGMENWPAGFGVDGGQMAAIKSLGMYFIGGKQVDYASGSTATSVPSILATVAAAGAQANFIGYNLGDEPFCGTGPYQIGDIPNEVSAVQAYDSTRPILFNQFNGPVWNALVPFCPSYAGAAFNALSVNSFDMYPDASPGIQSGHCQESAYVQNSDSLTAPNDCIWSNGMGAQQLRAFAPTRPPWIFVESGSDGPSAVGPHGFIADVTNGSNIVVNRSAYYHQNVNSSLPISVFASPWVGLTMNNSCIPGGATITSIVDSTHAVMSANATCDSSLTTVNVTGGSSIGGGSTDDCVPSANLCVASGSRWRATPAEVNAEVWVTIISGAYGIEWFCYDYQSLLGTFCLGDPAGGADAAASASNLTYINGILTTYAHQLNALTLGICSMQNLDAGRTTATSCTDGTLTMATGTAAVPGLAQIHSYGGIHYLFAMSDRCSASGATFTFTSTGDAGKTATVVYDSYSHYLPAHDSTGATHLLNGSAQFTDGLGVNGVSCEGTGGDYQVKIYAIQ